MGLFWWLDQDKLQMVWTKATGRQCQPLTEGLVRTSRLWWFQKGPPKSMPSIFSWGFPKMIVCLVGTCVCAVLEEKERQGSLRAHEVTLDVQIESCRKQEKSSQCPWEAKYWDAFAPLAPNMGASLLLANYVLHCKSGTGKENTLPII